MQTTRRGAFGLAAALGTLAAAPAARAAVPMQRSQAPAWYRFRIGEFEATAVSDGHLPLGRPGDGFPRAPAGEMTELLRENFLPTDGVLLEQNALVVNTGRHLVLFDTGMGDSMGQASQMFGPTTGKLHENLRAAGFAPEQFDVIALTHAHCDHAWGLVDAEGRKLFPNARVALAEADLRYWTDDGNKRGAAFMVPFIDGAKKNLEPYRDGMITVRDGAEVVPGITAISTPGHTVGHTCYAVSSGGMTVVNTGDLAHHPVIMLRRPAWEFAYDTDPAQSARTRQRMLDRLANERHHVLSYHFPWPGLGQVARTGSEGYAWVPANMNVTGVG